jgi:uncharacterized membrane protein
MGVAAQAGQGAEAAAAFPLMVILATLVFMVLLMPLSALLMGGMYKSAFKQLRGGQLEFSDLFSARDRVWSILGAMLLTGLAVLIGLVLCVIPAFIAIGLFFFAVPLVVEKGLGPVEALRASSDVTRQNLLMFTLYALVVQLIGSVGSYACYIGLLVTYPLIFTMTAVAYRDCCGLGGARTFLPADQIPATEYSTPPPASAVTPARSQCRNCNIALPPAATFCPRCGSRAGA